MINSANKYTVAEIFMTENPIKFVIPKYQREYTWSKNNWEELLNDIIESDGHFIGSIICINNGKDTIHPELELIDGQQRLSTISLIFCAIYQKLKESGVNDEDTKLELGNLKWRLIQKGNAKGLRLELSHQNNNNSDYKAILHEIGIIEYDTKVPNSGNRRIFKAFRYFLDRLEEYDNKELLELLVKLNRTILVKIEVNSHSDAFLLFESLNNRGVPLSAIDLIKNKMLSELEKTKKMTTDEAFDKWNVIIKNLPEYSVQERFLRHYYNAFKNNEKVHIEKTPRATRSNLIRIYESLIERDVDFIFRDLTEKSQIYSEAVTPEESEMEPFVTLNASLVDLVNVSASPSYILLLYFFSKKDTLSVDFFKQLIDLLVKYFLRRALTDFPATRNLDPMFIELIDQIENNDANCDIDFITEYLTHENRFSSLLTFKEKLNGDIYDLNTDATRFILSKIEETKRTKEIHTNFWERDKGDKLVWTIEHIFPEGRNIPKAWIEMIAEGDKDQAYDIQESYVHKLGNLTLTGYNSNLSNFDFEKKRDRKDKNDKNIGYKNGLFLNEEVQSKTTWTKEDIENRTEKLVDLAIDIFKIDNK